jgi:DNA polymerase-3 subunit beta
MKLVVNKDVLLDGLQKVQSIVATRSTLPVLYNVYLKVEKDRLWLTATDLEVTVRTSLEAKISRTGGTTVPARRFFSICRELPSNDIEIDADDKDVVSIKAGASRYKIIGISEDEFPPLPTFKGNRSYSLDQKVFKTMLASTHYAASADASRPALCGVLASFREGKMNMVATDGRRMAMWEQDLAMEKNTDGQCVIPAKTVAELLRSLGEEGQVTLQLSDNQVAIEFGQMLVMSKLIDANYPNYRQVIPVDSGDRVVVEREMLLNAVRRVALLLSDKSNSITLTFGKDTLEVSASSADVGEATESLSIKHRGKEMAIAFNPDFLMDPLKVLGSDEVSLELTNELSPAVLRCDKPFQCVIMPMRVK